MVKGLRLNFMGIFLARTFFSEPRWPSGRVGYGVWYGVFSSEFTANDLFGNIGAISRFSGISLKIFENPWTLLFFQILNLANTPTWRAHRLQAGASFPNATQVPWMRNAGECWFLFVKMSIKSWFCEGTTVSLVMYFLFVSLITQVCTCETLPYSL